MRILLPLLLCFLAITSDFARAEDAPLELRLIVPEGTAGAVKKSIKGREGQKDQELYCAAEVLLDASAVKEASAFFDAVNGWGVTAKLTETGARLLAEATTKHVHERIGILSAGRLLVAPYVNEPITGGMFQISGNFTEEEARAIADSLQKKAAAK